MAATITALALSVATPWLTACAPAPGLRDAPAGRVDRAGDGYAPPVGPPAIDAANEDRWMARAAARADASPTPSPAATSGESVTTPVAAAGTTPGTAAVASQPVGGGYVDTLIENRLPGTPGWRTVRSTRRTEIEGYADAVSVTAGTPVRLFVNATARTFQIQLLRVGWYDGVGARQIWMSQPVRGGPQPDAKIDPTTHLITTPWTVSAVLPTGGLVAGDYLAKLLGSDGASSFVPLTVRELHTAGAVLMLNSALTWLAYNTWGGANTYRASDAASSELAYARRSVVTSFDRPYAEGFGTGGLLDEEDNLILTAERLGLRLNYAADVDLQVHPEVADGATGIALLGHSEYWSRQMRAVLTAARDSGVNLAFLGANDIFRRIRLQPSANGPARVMTNYKDGAADPIKTADTTADWPHRPFDDAESSLTGVQYRCARARADLVISDPQAWVFEGLGLRAGQTLPGMVGSETDRVSLGVPTPRPIQIMAHSPVTCYGYREFSDLIWYTTPSGAGVFAAGTLDWNAGISSSDAVTRAVVRTVTERVLKMMARPQAGLVLPAVDNPPLFYAPTGAALVAHGAPVVVAAAGPTPAHPSGA